MRTVRLLAIVAANAAMQMAAVLAARFSEAELNYIRKEREAKREAAKPRTPGWWQEAKQVRED